MIKPIQSQAPRICADAPLPPHVVALIRERRRRLAAVARYDRYILQARGHLVLQGFWRDLKRQDLEDAHRLKNRLEEEIADQV